MEIQTLIREFIEENEIVTSFEDNIETVVGVWIDNKDYNVITQLVERCVKAKTSDEHSNCNKPHVSNNEVSVCFARIQQENCSRFKNMGCEGCVNYKTN